MLDPTINESNVYFGLSDELMVERDRVDPEGRSESAAIEDTTSLVVSRLMTRFLDVFTL